MILRGVFPLVVSELIHLAPSCCVKKLRLKHLISSNPWKSIIALLWKRKKTKIEYISIDTTNKAHHWEIMPY
jgi:hypothetical protein